MRRYYCDVCEKEYRLINSDIVCDWYSPSKPTDSLFEGLKQENSDICLECRERLSRVLFHEIIAIQKENKK